MKFFNYRFLGSGLCIAIFLVLAAASDDTTTTPSRQYQDSDTIPSQNSAPVRMYNELEENASDYDEEMVIIVNSIEDEEEEMI